MKTSLDHLPAHKQEEIISITNTIVQLVKPEMVILFGSYSRGDWVEDRYMENGTLYEYRSDYDILVVTEHHQDIPAGFGKQVRKRVKRAENLQTIPHIIFHDINFLNKELEEGHYFFRDILYEGTMLYTTGNYELATPRKLSANERADKARLYFKEWFHSANEFLIDFNNAFNRASYPKAIFELHQATERYFMTILLVFTDYKPQTHDLDDLNKQVGYVDARFKTVFPNQTEEEKRLFNLLVKSYIDSRYKMGYAVAQIDLINLVNNINQLKTLTKSVCMDKIATLSESG